MVYQSFTIMEYKYLLKVVFLVTFIFCVQSSTNRTNETVSSTKSLENSTILVNESSPIHYGCKTCNLTANTVCVDGNCYCGPNFYWSIPYQTCIEKNCYSDSDCYQPQDPYRQCNCNNLCVCDNNYYEDWTNGRKCVYQVPTTPRQTKTQPTTTQQSTTEQDSFVVYTNCTNCYKYLELVCIDQKCYCAPNYEWNPIQKNCYYMRCFADYACFTTQDIERHCDRDGVCVCNINYYEDWTNGRKCTYRLSIWTWVWVFALIPIAAIIFGITLCVRKKRAHQGHSHLINTPQEPPPSYGSEQVPSFVHK